ncbi:MAG: exo-beta-N-acetylmuramidase NamZ domain-containing protein [Gemmatimonadaceae bacterium]
MRRGLGWLGAAGTLAVTACAVGRAGGDTREGAGRARRGRVEPGIEVLLADSIHLVRGKRVGLLTNQTGVSRDGRSDIDLLSRDKRATAAGVHLVTLFSPEHGIRGTEDREFVESGVDAKSGLPVISLYGSMTVAPPDSALRRLDVLVFDLQDIGTRTWTYVGNLVYALRAARRTGVRVVVLDRPAPLTGAHADGPMLDSALANPEDPTTARPGLAYALYPFPLRHGMTMGEMALFYNRELGIGADLVVVPMRGWRRDQWYDETGLPWVRPSPNLPSLTSALVYPALVGFEGSNLSVGRGTAAAFQRFGAPWLDARRTAALLNERGLGGVRFEAEPFTPRSPGDRKYADREIPGVRVVVTNRELVQVGRVGAAILWAVRRTAGDSLRIDARAFDLRFGSPAARQALLAGDDPDAVIDRSLPAVVAFTTNARRYFLYK